MSFEPCIQRIQDLCALPEHKDKVLVPIYMDAVADVDTPVSVFLKIKEGNTHSFLFESVAPGEKIARYSFIGSNPLKVVETGEGHEYSGDPLINLEKEMKNFSVIQLDELKVPMTGGAVGYCSFDAIRHFEPKIGPYIAKQKDVLQIPESIYMFFDTIVIFDHVFHSLKIVSHCRLDTPDLYTAYEEAKQKILQVQSAIEKPFVRPSILPLTKDTADSIKIDIEACSNVGRQGYMDFVSKLKEHIVDGDIFQAVPSQVDDTISFSL
jgi:anthranilate synthase component 1